MKGHRLWCIEDGEEKCIVSRDVILDELIIALHKSSEEQVSQMKSTFVGGCELDFSKQKDKALLDPVVEHQNDEIQLPNENVEEQNLQNYR